MKDITIETVRRESPAPPASVRDELANYEEQIRKYRAGEVDETWPWLPVRGPEMLQRALGRIWLPIPSLF